MAAKSKKEQSTTISVADQRALLVQGMESAEKGSVGYVSDVDFLSPVTSGIPTGLPWLDVGLGRPGWPEGRLVEITGREASGKTTLINFIIAQYQKYGGIAILADTERTFDIPWAQKCGVICDDQSIPTLKPPEKKGVPPIITMEFVFNRIKDILRTLDTIPKAQQHPTVFVLDSIKATPSMQDVNKEVGDKTYSAVAAILSEQMPIVAQWMSRHRFTLVVTNQHRQKMNPKPWEPKFIVPGGEAIPFYASVRIQTALIKSLKEDNDREYTGPSSRHQTFFWKNKIGPPHRKTQFTINYESGLDRLYGLFEAALNVQLLTQAGSWYTFTPTGDKMQGFQRDTWEEMLNKAYGGQEQFYGAWMQHMVDNRLLIPYGRAEV